MAEALPYQIVSVVQHPEWNEGLQTTVQGSTVKAIWLATNSVVSVFVPATADLVQGSDQLIRARGAQLDQLFAVKA